MTTIERSLTKSEQMMRFTETAAEINGSDVNECIEALFKAGLAPRNFNGVQTLVREMAGVMTYVFPDNKTELFREQLDIETIAEELEKTPEYVSAVADHMAQFNLVLSQEKRIRQRTQYLNGVGATLRRFRNYERG